MPRYFDLEVSLCDLEPRIYRRFLIRGTATFATLHMAIQDACGWCNCHLYALRTCQEHAPGTDIVGVPDEEFDDEFPVPPASRVKLTSYFERAPGGRCFYLYDFGDDWWHEVVLRGVEENLEVFQRRLIAGARAFPREDCGGLPGYADCVKALAGDDAGLDDADSLRTWLGDWRPETFDLERTAAVTFNQDVKALVPQQIEASLLLFAMLDGQEVLLGRVESSGHGTGKLPSEILLSHPVVMPYAEVQRKLAGIFTTINDRIASARAEIRHLAALRDMLLPALLSGELPVGGAERVLEAQA